jgi:hypothetical protein
MSSDLNRSDLPNRDEVEVKRMLAVLVRKIEREPLGELTLP